MSRVEWWSSFERMDAIFRISTTVAIAAATVAAACWIVTLTLTAAAGTVLATASSLVALFSWLRRDDLASRNRPRP